MARSMGAVVMLRLRRRIRVVCEVEQVGGSDSRMKSEEPRGERERSRGVCLPVLVVVHTTA